MNNKFATMLVNLNADPELAGPSQNIGSYPTYAAAADALAKTRSAAEENSCNATPVQNGYVFTNMLTGACVMVTIQAL